jgi:5-methylcytosine-specific restriction endonuclease McrA
VQEKTKRYDVASPKCGHTLAEWLAVRRHYGEKCLRCGATDRTLTRDHVVPLALGGADTIDNIQPLCGPCNCWKGARVIDFREVGRRVSQCRRTSGKLRVRGDGFLSTKPHRLWE